MTDMRLCYVNVLCFRQYSCPMLLPHQRPPRPWSRKGLLMKQQQYHHHQHNNSIYSDDSSSGTAVSQRITQSLSRMPPSSKATRQQHPSAHNPAVRSVSGADVVVSGTSYQLIDSLTRFFTPSNKRKSRVSLNSYSSSVVGTLLTAAARRRAANKLVRRARMVQAVRGRRDSDNRWGDIDGISHLFNARGGQPLGVHSDKWGVDLYGGQLKGRVWEQGREGQWTSEQGMYEGSNQSGRQRRSSGVVTPGFRGCSGAVIEGKSPRSCLHATHTSWGRQLGACHFSAAHCATLSFACLTRSSH